MHLIENGISEQTANRIQTLFDKDGPFEDVIAHLKNFTKTQTEVNKSFISINEEILFLQGSRLLKNIVEELETIVKYARCFGVTMPVRIRILLF